ncbi:hypothetical protein SCA6_004182 [Theobroma cacao]
MQGPVNVIVSRKQSMADSREMKIGFEMVWDPKHLSKAPTLFKFDGIVVVDSPMASSSVEAITYSNALISVPANTRCPDGRIICPACPPVRLLECSAQVIGYSLAMVSPEFSLNFASRLLSILN